MGRRATDGVAGIAAESDETKAGSDGSGGPSAGTGGDAIQRVRIPGIAGQDRTDGFIGTEGPLGHIRFGEYEGARVLHTFHLKGVLAGNEFREGERAVGGSESLGFEIILDDHRNAVKGSGQAGLSETAVQ